MPAARAIVNNHVLMQPDPAVSPGHQILMAVLAKPFLERRRQLDFILHRNPSCHLHILVR